MIPCRHRPYRIAVIAASGALATLLAIGAVDAREEHDRQGPIMANAKIGPAIGVAKAFKGFTAFDLELEAGYAVIPNRGYITFEPSFAFGDLTLITLAAGFQFEFPLPIEKLYAYGRATLGAGFITQGGSPAFHFGPHAGAKYQITSMFHAGLEPLSLAFYAAEGGVGMHYRILAYGGVDF